MEVVKAYDDQDTSWCDEVQTGFLKLEEGEHEIVFLCPPNKVKSKYGKDQFVFSVKLDGRIGNLVPPKALAGILAGMIKQGSQWPVSLRVKREFMDIRTKISLIQETPKAV